MTPSRLAAALLAFTVWANAWAQESFDRLVVFGTSLSDPGNAFALYGGTNTPHDYEVDPLLVPNPTVPYVRGGHHFSNGATWVEQFARPWGLAGTVRPGFQASDVMATNFAVGGARAREVGVGEALLDVDVGQDVEAADHRGERRGDRGEGNHAIRSGAAPALCALLRAVRGAAARHGTSRTAARSDICPAPRASTRFRSGASGG